MRTKSNKPKLSDVAAAANVSIATASMALSGKGRISTGVRKRILGSATQLGYRSKTDSRVSSIIGTKRAGIFLQMDDRWAHTFNIMRPILLSLEKGLAGHCNTLILPIDDQMADEEILRSIETAAIDALFSIHYGNERLFTLLEKRGIPVILINNSGFGNRFHAIGVDDFLGAHEGAVHLLDGGHKRIVYAEYRRSDMSALLTNRFCGFKKALDERRIVMGDDHRITIDRNDTADLQKKISALFAGRNRPTAIFAHDDHLAAFIISVLSALGYRVPDDVSIIAPGDVLDYNEPFLPKITTMQIPTAQMGKLAAEAMLNRLSNHSTEINVVNIRPQRVDRGSCKSIP